MKQFNQIILAEKVQVLKGILERKGYKVSLSDCNDSIDVELNGKNMNVPYETINDYTLEFTINAVDASLKFGVKKETGYEAKYNWMVKEIEEMIKNIDSVHSMVVKNFDSEDRYRKGHEHSSKAAIGFLKLILEYKDKEVR